MKQLLIPFILLLLGSCDARTHFTDSLETKESAIILDESPPRSTKSYTENETSAGSSQDADDLKTGKQQAAEKTPLLIIKNASVQFQVTDAEASHTKIAALLGPHNAYFGSDNRSSNNYQVENNMVIRVPAANFDKLMEALMQESVYTNYKNISADDVTAEFTDIQARLKTKKEVEQRYLALLKQAGKITDILEVEEKLRVIREEIEAAEGRVKLLRDQVGYSTITLNIYQKLNYTPAPQVGFLSNLTEAFVNGWRALLAVLVGLVNVWPFLLLITAAIWLVVRLRRRNK